MKGKTNLGKVLLSVVIAIAMVATTIPAIAVITETDNGNDNAPGPSGDPGNYDWAVTDQKEMPVGTVQPDATVYPLTWYIVDHSGDGIFSPSVSYNGYDWNQTVVDVEDDYLNASFNITALCVNSVWLQWEDIGGGTPYNVTIDGTPVVSVPPGPWTAGAPTKYEANITLLVTLNTLHNLSFDVFGAQPLGRNFSIYNVTISANYTIDIVINEIMNMTSGMHLATFPLAIDVNVSNNGNNPANMVDFHLQIYKEETPEPIIFQCWDMETCGTGNPWDWDAFDWDGDGITWYWTELRSHSATHSWHDHPDWLTTYEANSYDSLILKNAVTIPSTYMGWTVGSAYLTFWHWCEGEFDGTNPVDYGTVHLDIGANSYQYGSPAYYDTGGAWVQERIDISANISEAVKFNFTWQTDDHINREGWYIDDVCIELTLGSLQPLIFQGYKYENFTAHETKIIRFPIIFEPEEGTYFIQVYSDYPDCKRDDIYPQYADEVNYTIYFGDICDGEVTSIYAPPSVQMPNNPCGEHLNWVHVPINVTVHNNGTLAKEIPVKISARHQVTDVIFKDDMESGGAAWEDFDMAGATASNPWTLTDTMYFTPTHSWANIDPMNGADRTIRTVADHYSDLILENVNIKNQLSYNLGANVVGYPVLSTSGGVFVLGLYYGPAGLPYDEAAAPFVGSSGGWTEFDWNDYITSNTLYWEHNGFWGGFGELSGIDELVLNIETRYGDNDPHPGFNIRTFGAGSGGNMAFDDFMIYRTYAGAEAWSTTATTSLLNPCESENISVIWNTTEYCDYLITGEVTLDCDMDPTNDAMSTPTRVWKLIYPSDEWESWEQEDNTWCFPADWHIVPECSLCPDNHFWWNGPVGGTTYGSDRNDCLIINQTFNFTGATIAWFNFSHKFLIETGFDYGYIEVSNDSAGKAGHWFRLTNGTYTGNNTGYPNWENISIDLVPGVSPMYSDYTSSSFVMPASFFTDMMHFRFRFYSDSIAEEKGWYVDNVNLTIVNGTGTFTLFFDDMENTTASDWFVKYIWYGCHWHEEDVFGAPYPNPPVAFWNGQNKTWIGTGTIWFQNTQLTPGGAWLWGWGEDDNLGDGGWTNPPVFTHGWVTAGIDAAQWCALWDQLGGLNDQEDDWINVTINQSVFAGQPAITLQFWWLADWWALGLGNPAETVYVTMENISHGGTRIHNYSFIYPPVPPAPGAGVWTQFVIPVNEFADSQHNVTLGWHVNQTLPAVTDGDVYYSLDNPELIGLGPTIPDHTYYNNVDEKLILYYDLTHAFEAFFEWDQNYSFADANDIGYVEIWTGTTWKTLYVATGNTGGVWGHVKLDISDYVGGSDLTKIRFRFVSDSSGTSYGWLIDDPMVQGKIDYHNPTVVCSASPATPDGCGGWYKSAVTCTVVATDNVEVAEVKYRIDGGAWKTYSTPIPINVDGTHTFEAQAFDEVGNPSDICILTFKIDATAPTSSITVPQAGYIYFMGRELFANPLGGTIILGGLEFQAQANDALSGVKYVSFEINGYTYDDASSPYAIWWHKFDLLPTSYTLTVSATDEACNKGASSTVDFTHWL
jgi:hypothetical protein